MRRGFTPGTCLVDAHGQNEWTMIRPKMRTSLIAGRLHMPTTTTFVIQPDDYFSTCFVTGRINSKKFISGLFGMMSNFFLINSRVSPIHTFDPKDSLPEASLLPSPVRHIRLFYRLRSKLILYWIESIKKQPGTE